VNKRGGRDHHAEVDLVFKKLKVGAEGREHLRGALAVAEVCQTLDAGVVEDVVEDSRLVVLTHVVEAEVPELLVAVRIQVLVVAREPVASCVVKPDIKTGICEEESHGLGSVAANASRRVQKPVLIQEDWFLLLLCVVFLRVRALLAIDPEDGVDVAIFGDIYMLFEGIAIRADKQVEPSVFVFVIAEL